MKSLRSLTIAAFALLPLAACGQQSGSGEEPVEAVDAAPEGLPGITVTNGRLILPAVAANPAAVYFVLSYNGETPTTLAGVDVAGAGSAMLHHYEEKDGVMSMTEMPAPEIVDGGTLSFEPGGAHVMAMGLDGSLEAGSKTEVTLIFASGDKYTFEAEVLAPNAAR